MTTPKSYFRIDKNQSGLSVTLSGGRRVNLISSPFPTSLLDSAPELYAGVAILLARLGCLLSKVPGLEEALDGDADAIEAVEVLTRVLVEVQGKNLESLVG